MRLFLISFAIALVMFPPYLALYHGVDFAFSGVVMVPVMAVHFVAMLVHETGHTITRWLFGYPAFPVFDLEISLGMTRWGARNMVFLASIWGAMAAGVIYLKKKKLYRQMIILAGAAILHGVIAFLPLHEIIILYMGHGMEAVVAFGCIMAALYCMDKYHPAWRVALMSAALYIMLKTVLMCLELMFTKLTASFGIMKGGQYMNDFLRLQKMTGWSVPACASVLLAATLALIAAAAVTAYRKERKK